MKKLVLSFFVLLFALAAIAQDYPNTDAQGLKPSGDTHLTRRRGSGCSRAYFDLSTGINNNGGLLGVGMDVHVSTDISINGGLGILTTWGYKVYGGGKYFFNPCHKGWALGGGLTYSTGVEERKATMETIFGKQNVIVTLEPQLNFYASAYKYWSVGRKSNRMFLQLGLSAPLLQHKFTQVSGAPLSKDASDRLRAWSPGGLIIGFGFAFGLHHHAS